MNKINHLLLTVFLAVISACSLNAQQFFYSAENPGSCAATDGIITIVPTRGVPPFTYLWSTGATTVSLRNAPKGTYSATLTDATGATVVHTHILNSKEFDLELVNALPVGFCNPNSGLLSIAPMGGTGPYTYTWSDGQTGSTAQSLAIGPYSVTVQDASGCIAQGAYEVGQTALNYYPTALIVATNEPDCINTANGVLEANMTQSGYPPYTYAWDNGASTSTNSNLSAGNYAVTITDALGCIAVSNYSLQKKMTATGSVVCSGMNTGTASAVLENAAAPVSYAWSNGQSGPSLSNLPNGDYGVTISDANGCSAAGTVSVKIPSLYLNDYSPKCYSGNNGIGICSVNYDVASSFLWDNGDTDYYSKTLSPGAHTVMVTTALGCVLQGNLNIAAPIAPAITISSLPTAANCLNGQGGAMNLSVTGGFLPYNYVVYGENGFFSSSATSLQNIDAGTYYVYVSSGNSGCNSGQTITVPETNGFEPTLVTTEIDCATGFGAAAVMDVTMPGATYQWAHGATSPALYNLTEGCYTVTVTAGGTCQKYFQFCLYKEDSLQLNSCGAITSGRLVNDLGAPGCAGTTGIPYQAIRNQSTGALNFTDAAGMYSFNLPTGTFNLELPQYNPADIMCPASGVHTVNSIAGIGNFGLDFHYLNANNTDHRVRQTPLRTAQPGYPYSMRLEVCNDGITVNPGTLDLEYGNFLGPVSGRFFPQHTAAFVLNSETVGTPNNTANFSFPGIAAGSCELLQLDLLTPTTTASNSAFLSSALVSPSSGDPTPANNESVLYNTVMGSFDPNVVLAYPARNGNPKDGGDIVRYEDNTLVYQIFFQNTGNAPANLVLVKDTIDSRLNLASIRNITASHNMTVSTETDNNNVLVFKFNNINLPDSTSDYAGSIGSIQYEIDLKPGLDLGTKINKRAAIFFDFNSPVITNQNTLEIVSASRTRVPKSADAISTFPNPADDYVGIYCEESAQLKLYSALGALIQSQQLDSGLQQVNTSNLPNGIYMITLEAHGKTRSGKVVVQH